MSGFDNGIVNFVDTVWIYTAIRKTRGKFGLTSQMSSAKLNWDLRNALRWLNFEVAALDSD